MIMLPGMVWNSSVSIVIVENIFAQFCVIGVQHPLRRAGVDVALAVMAGVKQQRGAALDADIAKAEKQRAVRLAVPLMRNSSPLALARSISGWKSLYQPPLPNRSEVAA